MICGLLISTYPEWPPEVLDASKGISAEKLKERIDKAALIVKTTYWYVRHRVLVECINSVVCAQHGT